MVRLGCLKILSCATWNFPEIDLKTEYKETIEESKAVISEMAGISRENYKLLTPFGIDELRYSSLTKLLNATAYW